MSKLKAASTRTGKARSQQRGVRPRRKAWLASSTVDKISNKLHESIQFYNEHGQPANSSVLKAIKDCLNEVA